MTRFRPYLMVDRASRTIEFRKLAFGAVELRRFSIARIVAVFRLATGMALKAAVGKYQGKQTGENSPFRTLHTMLRAGAVAPADRDPAAGLAYSAPAPNMARTSRH